MKSVVAITLFIYDSVPAKENKTINVGRLLENLLLNRGDKLSLHNLAFVKFLSWIPTFVVNNIAAIEKTKVRTKPVL